MATSNRFPLRWVERRPLLRYDAPAAKLGGVQRGRAASNSREGSVPCHYAARNDHDFCTSVKKLQPWAQKLSKEPDSRFAYEEVVGAGHFWHEHGVQPRLREAIRRWVQSLKDP